MTIDMENRAQQLSHLTSELRIVKSELEDVEQQISSLLERQQALLTKKNELMKEIKSIESDSTGSGSSSSGQTVDWGSKDFSWTGKLDECLRNKFGIEEFRVYQRETINATMSGVDCILIMPTGGGKSLCFQLPAVISKGFTLVISPLISLMEDQLLALVDLSINAALLNASSSREHVNRIHSEMISKKEDDLKLLYVTPEKIAKSKRFMAKLEKAYEAGKLTRIVIDEVHCTSQWGHDFRPDYKILGILKRQFPTVPILGLTATASSKIIQDVRKILNLQHGCVIFRASFNRPNLFYEVRTRSLSSEAHIDEIASTIQNEFKGQSGIVYCFSRKDAETVTVGLQKRGLLAGCYHADLDNASRTYVHHSWTQNAIQVVVATVAFGMGIDKSNVRFVIHYSISKSMENFYQESGRAGRDDKTAKCILYYKFQDAFRQATMVFTEQTGLDNLYGMLEYCLDMKTCRRKLISKHFGEAWDPVDCNKMCDNCQRAEENSVLEKDVTQHAKSVLKILQHAARIRERITPLKIVDAWLGKGQLNLRVPTVQPPSLTAGSCERIVLLLLLKKIVKEDFHFTPYSTICYLVEGPRNNMVLTDKMKVFMDFEQSSSKSAKVTQRKSEALDELDKPQKFEMKESVDSQSFSKRPKPNSSFKRKSINKSEVDTRKSECFSNVKKPGKLQRKRSLDSKILAKRLKLSSKVKGSSSKVKSTSSKDILSDKASVSYMSQTFESGSSNKDVIDVHNTSNNFGQYDNSYSQNNELVNESGDDDDDGFEAFLSKSKGSSSKHGLMQIDSDSD